MDNSTKVIDQAERQLEYLEDDSPTLSYMTVQLLVEILKTLKRMERVESIGKVSKEFSSR